MFCVNYVIEDDVPEYWDIVIEAFIGSVQFHTDLMNGVPIDNLRFYKNRGVLKIEYTGGDKIIDAFAFFAAKTSELICSACGSKATRRSFLDPRCEECA